MVKLQNICKSFGNNNVLKGLSFTVKKGEIFALLGHNGAGKTTTLRIILGLLSTQSGTIEVFGKDPLKSSESLREVCGVLSEDNGLYESLTVYENLKFFAQIYKKAPTYYEPKIDFLLKEFEIFDKKHEVIKDFSSGMKKKVALIRTILHEPKLVLLDEPTNALDPISINKLHEIILKMAKEQGTTFIITTHNLDEVQKICDEIVIVKNGINVFNRNLHKEGLGDFCETKISITANLDKSKQAIENSIHKIDQTLKYKFENESIFIETIDKNKIGEIVKELTLKGFLIFEVSRNEFSLQKIYERENEAQ